MADVVDLNDRRRRRDGITIGLRESDLAVCLTWEDGGQEVEWAFTAKQARAFASKLQRWAMNGERAARARMPVPRWIQWVNVASIEDLVREAGLPPVVAGAIVAARTPRVQQGGSHVDANGCRVTWPTVTIGGPFGARWNGEGVRGLGPARLERLRAAGDRLGPEAARRLTAIDGGKRGRRG